MVKIKEYQVNRHGAGYMMYLPKMWLEDTGLESGDKIEMYRDIEDRLILVPKQINKLEKEDQASDLRKMMEDKA
jgi:bifunctional DNA-binding transcriptional regulator/antitoxin component of YhaV-PrlF toxin-antitoxin module